MKWTAPTLLVTATTVIGYWAVDHVVNDSVSWPGVIGGALGACLGLIVLGVTGERTSTLKPVDFEFGLFGQKVKLAIDDSQRRAAWALWVEYGSRIATVPLKQDEGLLREALTSYYDLFKLTREALKAAGPAAHPVAVASLRMLNEGIRPTMAYWHPTLKRYEEKRPAAESAAEWEENWNYAPLLRQELANVSEQLRSWVGILEQLAKSTGPVGVLPEMVRPVLVRPS